tara:strand:+ start:876 stop:2663 length:1788 start_codon:yes stop_codon:yes gene_type:complete
MAITINGQAAFQFEPLQYTGSNLFGAFPNVFNHINSVNSPLTYQVAWSGLAEDQNASAQNWTGATPDASTGSGDVIKAVFDIQTTLKEGASDFKIMTTIEKQKDIINSKFDSGTSAPSQKFTIDIAPILRNQLSYSLCPINKGTWKSNLYGGMNGGAVMQDNVLSNAGFAGSYVSNYNVSNNGTYLNVRVRVSFKVLNGNGEIVDADGTTKLYSKRFPVINSVSDWHKYRLPKGSSVFKSGTSDSVFFSRCPNIASTFKKSVRMDEQAEFLQFYVWRSVWANINGNSPSNMADSDVGAIGFEVKTYDASGVQNTFFIRDFEDNLIEENNSTLGKNFIKDDQSSMCVQNVSPSYIKNTATKYSAPNGTGAFPYWNSYSGDTIDDDTLYYTVRAYRYGLLQCTDPSSTTTRKGSSETRYYQIDREDDNLAYGFVRFHWLNSLGGIDSYTAKRDVTEGLTISKDIIERKSVDRMHYQTSVNLSVSISDTMRGGDLYKGGREVMNVNAERNLSVYTEPLNTETADWLEEIFTSTNVWVEMDTEATKLGNTRNSNLRPSTKGYIPVIITNSDVETVNQEQGLVKFNIEYVLAHKVETQRT